MRQEMGRRVGRKGREDLFVIGYRRREDQQNPGLPFSLARSALQ